VTEADWLVCAKPGPMLRELEWQGKLSSRKQQLWVCSCVKRLGHLLLDERLRAGVVARDMYADDLVSTHELRAAEAAARQAREQTPLPPGFGSGIDGIVPAAAPVWAAFAAVAAVEGSRALQLVPICVLEAVRCEASSALREAVSHDWAEATAAAEWMAQADLVRDVFGNPFRPVALSPSGLTPTVTGLAEAIYREEAFDRMPVLADALEEAGCSDPDLPGHLRSPGPHVRGCWALDLILGKE
jgi:hypothetical protein